MKRLITKCLLLFVTTTMLSSLVFAGCPIPVLPGGTGTSGNARAPIGTFRYERVVYLVTAADIAAAGFPSGEVIGTIGWDYSTAASATSTGTLSVYFENTTDATNLKSTSWATATGTMSLAHSGSVTLPGTPTLAFEVPLTGTPFTYTGNGVYVAFEWSNPAGLLSTGTVVNCNTALAGGLLGAQSNTALPTTMAASAFRPSTRFTSAGFANDARVDLIYTLGSMPNIFTASHVMLARVTNVGNNTLTNLPVTLNISGANTFSDVQVVASLAPCSSATVTFTGFTPSATGTNTVNVSVPADDYNPNNLKTLSQPVTSNLYSYKYQGSAISGGVGFNAGILGVFVSKFNTAIPALINEVKVDFQTATAARQFRIAIYDELGGLPNTLLYSSPAVINITSAAQQAFVPISPAVVVSGNFFVGVIQETTNTTNIGFSYQTENPSRSGTFFFANALSGGPWTDFGTGFPYRSAIEVQLYIPQPPNCAILNAPADLGSACINGTTLTWASGGGGPTGYRLTFGNNSPNYDNILNNSDLGNVTSYATGALTSGTYGWKIVAYNVDGDATGCATRTFTTNLAACYCDPTYGSGTGFGDYISLIEIPTTTLSNTTGASTAPYYTLFPQAGSTTGSLGTGFNYTMNVAGGTFADCFIRGWIDYNQDGTFSATESIGLSANCGALTTVSFNFLVPPGASTGTTRMRLRSSDTAPGPADIDACGNTNSDFGETEDYDITIFAPAVCSTTPVPGTTTSTSNPVCQGVSFTLGTSNTFTESGISYQWESSPNGSTWTPIAGATNALLTTTQSAATWYHCIVTCAGNGSGTSSDLQITMSAFLNCYCIPVHFGCGNGDVTNVTFNTLNNTTTCTGSAYESFPASGTTTTSVNKGTVHNLSVTTNDVCIISVWIDWDHSGTFDISEHTQVAISSTANVASVVPISIPVSAMAGQTGMRIRSRFAGNPNGPGDACLAMGSGEGEDYTITVNCGGSAANGGPICDGLNLNLFSGPTGATFSWTGPDSYSSAVQNPVIPNAEVGTNNGTYNVTITSPGCSENLSTVVVINPNPIVTVTATPPFCAGTNDLVIDADASGGAPIYIYDYLGDVTLDGIYVFPNAAASASGTYVVTVIDDNGCEGSGSVVATVWPLPTVTIVPIGPTNICIGQGSTDLQANGAVNYLWSTTETTALITVSTSGNYTVTGTDGNGCINTDNQAITESAPPAAPSVTPAGPVVLCTDGITTTSQVLTVTNYANDLLWSTSETTQSITIDVADVFFAIYTDGNGCFSVSNSVVSSVDIYSTPPTSATSNAPFNNICLGNTVTLDVLGGILGDNAQWVWYEGGCGSGSSIGTGASIIITPSSTGSHTYYVRSESVSCGNTSCVSVTVTVSPNTPTGLVQFTTFASAGCNGQVALFSTNAASGATFYSWNGTFGAKYSDAPGGPFVIGPFLTSVPSVYVQFATPPPAGVSGYSICVFASNACTSSITVCKWVRAKVSQPGLISGASIGCPSTNQTYSIAPVAGADTYTWTISGNATINGGTNTLTTASTSITVNFLAGWVNGVLGVYSSLNCGFNSASRIRAISTIPTIPGNISGPSYVCPGTSAGFSVAAVSGAASYNWSCSVPGAIITPSGNSCSILFPAVIPPGSQVCVTAVSSCGNSSASRCRGVASGLPGTPGNITGPAYGNCSINGVSFAVSTPSARATSYMWSLGGGAAIQFPNNLSAILVDFPSNFATGTIIVNGVNSCGNSASRSLVVNGAPALPGAISGNAVPCETDVETYTSTGSSGATSYNWTVPAGSTILSTPPYTGSILVQIGGTSGNITVAAVNTCGVSPTSSFAVTINCRLAQSSEASSGLVSLFPNPTTGKISLRFNSSVSEQVAMNVTDLFGKNIMRENFRIMEGINIHEMDLSSLAKGIYLIHLTGENMQDVLKVTVE